MSDQDANKNTDTDADVDTDRVDDDATDAPEGADQLGDAGKKALDSMKAKWKTERDARKALEAELEKFKSKNADKKTDDDTPDADTIRAQARAEAKAEALRERALDKLEAKAAKLFADPEDARALLAGNVEDFVDGDKVDVEAITEALSELLERKPHLAAAPPRRFEGSADGGARKGGSDTKLTREDVRKLAAQGKHDEIVKAKREGRIDYSK